MKRAKRPLGHIVERPKGSGRWAIVVSTRDAATGQRKRKWHTFPEDRSKSATQKEAQAELTRLIAEINGGLYLEPSKTTLAQYLERWLAHKKPSIEATTFERYADIARKNVAPLLGAVIITKLE